MILHFALIFVQICIYTHNSMFDVKVVSSSKIVCNKHYLMDWLGHTPNRHSWKLAENIDDASKLVIEFHCKYPNKQVLIHTL